MNKQEKRKLRNRELAAASRKRKNDEMERLKKENEELKLKIIKLESNTHEWNDDGMACMTSDCCIDHYNI